MLVVLMLKEKLLKLRLPNKISGNYLINDNYKNYVNIESDNNFWKVKGNKNVKILKNQSENYNEVTLSVNSFYVLSFSKTGDKGFLYCTDIYDNSFTQFNVNSANELIINNSSNSNIQYKTNLINGQQFKIYNKNKAWYFEAQANSTSYINDSIVTSSQILKNGDVIFIYGLKIIYLANTFIINNPNNNVFTNEKLLPLKKENAVPFIEDEDEIDIEEKEDEYFLRAPNLRGVIEREVINVDAPPAEEKIDDTPIAYVIGPMLSMGMISMVTLFSALNTYSSGKSSFGDIVPSLAISIAMLSGILIWPILNRRYQNRKKRKLEQKRQDKYRNYINKKSKEIDEIMTKQRQILSSNYPDVKECERIIIKKDMRLFERRIVNQDFLKVRLGVGNIPLDVDIRYPEEHFTMDDDKLVGILNQLVNKSKLLDNVPITFSFLDNKISAIVDENDIIKKNNYFHYLLMQLIAFHSYDELKIVWFLDEHTDIDVNCVKMLPHVWNNSRTFRFIADNTDDMKEISLYLEEILKERTSNEKNFGTKTRYTDFSTYYLIITDDYKKASNLQIISDLLQTNDNLGFSLLFIADSLNNLPNECTSFIDLKEGTCVAFTNELSLKKQLEFNIEKYDLINFYDATKVLNNIKIKMTKGTFLLPNTYEFLEMYKASNIEQLNCLDRWNKNDATLSLKALLGIDISGEGIYLDIHEKSHGPHGLIAGMTGSGKSELIITYILSMALNYHPDYVNFILIDYKGGSLAGAFHNNKLGIKLPHLVGTITNLDTLEMNRSLSSIQSELNRRQKIFNEARTKLDEGTIDIYKYQKMYQDGLVDEPVPHLIIISDEFAELKQQQPEFMEQLIRVARIGRSLGVHLILATQKPSGIVNEQIRSNSRFSICLKVQDKADSMDMIDRPDAASLKQAGRFYMQIGYNEYFTLGQAAWSGAPYIPSDKPVKKIDTSLTFVSNLGKTIKEVNNIKPLNINSNGEQLNNIIKYLSNISSSEGIVIKQLWLDKIPENIYLQNLRDKYKYQYIYNNINPIIGEYDDPLNQRQDVLTLPFSSEGNALLFGAADSGKELFLSSIIYDLITTHHTNEINIYVFDFGSESLRRFVNAPQVGDVVTVDNSEKVLNFFYMIQKEMERRKKFISESSDPKVVDRFPMILVIINNYEVFKDNYEKYDDILLNITRDSIKYKINFLLTASASNMIRFRLQQNFKIKIALQLNDDGDYSNILAGARRIKPSHIFGRGLVEVNDIVYEFQTMHVCEDEKYNSYLDYTFNELKKQENTRAKIIPILPDIVKIKHVINYMYDLSRVPVGITKLDLKVETYDLKNKFVTVFTGKRLDMLQKYGYNLFNMISTLQGVTVHVIDKHDSYSNKEISFLYNDCNSNFVNNSLNHNLYCFIGIDSLLDFTKFNNITIEILLEDLTMKKNSSILIMDSVQQVKSKEFDTWYKQYVVNSEGLWLGSGITEQFVLKYNQSGTKLDNNCDMNFGYIIKNGNAKLIKLLEMSVTDE